MFQSMKSLRTLLLGAGLMIAALLPAEEETSSYGALPIPKPDPSTLSEVNIVGSEARENLFRPTNLVRSTSSSSTTLPTAFDLRDEDAVNAVRKQDPWGTCWAFATVGSFESCLLKMYGEKADFSEWNLATHYAQTYYWLNKGGNVYYSEYHLSQMYGLPLEIEDPYHTSADGDYAYHQRPCSRAVGQVAYFTPPYDNSTETYALTDADYVTQIKTAIYTYGAVTTSYYHSDTYYNSTNKAYYCPSATAINHAVVLIGWDDTFSKNNFSTTPTNDGAWLVRNSWGENKQDYFWVSYDDALINEAGHVRQFRPLDPSCNLNFSRCYRHDSGEIPSGYLTLGTSTTVANVFTAEANEPLRYVQYYNHNTTGVAVSYTLTVYQSPTSGKPASGTKLTTQSGEFTEQGQYVIPLNSPQTLTAGTTFSIVFKLSVSSSSGESVMVMADDSDVTAACSYYLVSRGPMSSWTDLSTSSGCNLVLRAITTVAEEPDLPCGLMDWMEAVGLVSEETTSNGTVSDYETAANNLSTQTTSNALSVMDCYLAGLDPNEEAVFTTEISFDSEGNAVVTPNPYIPGRNYTLYSKKKLSDDWSATDDLTDKYFFKYRVSWQGEE